MRISTSAHREKKKESTRSQCEGGKKNHHKPKKSTSKQQNKQLVKWNTRLEPSLIQEKIIKTAMKMVLASLEMSLLHSEEAVTHDKPFSV